MEQKLIKQPNLTRRGFLKTMAAVTSAASAALSLPGVALGEKTDAVNSAAPSGIAFATDGQIENEQMKNIPGSDSPLAALEKIPQAYLNPQLDEKEYRGHTKELKLLFSPLQIGKLSLSHRMVKSAAGSACWLAGMTDELIEYYAQLAKGGVELIYVETVSFLEVPAGGEYDAETRAYLERLVSECGKYGAVLGYQLSGYGTGENEMSIEEIKAKQARFIEVAKGLWDVGFKAVELNCAGFNMPAHFLSRFHNTRTDAYGGKSIENRARFAAEIFAGIRQSVPDMVIQALIDCVEENDNLTNNPTIMTLDIDVTTPHTKPLTIEEGIAAAKCFEAAGVDSMHLRLGPLGYHTAQFAADILFIASGVEGATGFGTQYDFTRNFQGKAIGNTSGCGIALDIAAMYKKELSIPVGAVTYMDPAHAPDFFEQALEDGKLDFYMMNRPLTVDTQYINKLREDRIDEIAPCTRCLHCHSGSAPMNALYGYCRVNALTQRVMREGGTAAYELPKAAVKKKVMVIGGGPAGMEAARIAAMRGHDVTLYEKRGSLGFMLTFAATVKGPHENLEDLGKYLIRQLEITGVTVKTGVEVTKELIHSEAPDAVILAAGGLRDTLTVEADCPVIGMDSFMHAQMGENVIVCGSNAQAFDTALWLTVHKKHVTMVTPGKTEDFDIQQSQHARRMMTTVLYALGFNALPESRIKSVRDGVATVVMDTGLETCVPCDAIINAADMLPNLDLIDGISVKEVYAVGDCAAPFNIGKAIQAGNDAGRAV